MKIEFNGSPHGSNGFRSRLEFEVATELDEHDVDWAYEQQVILPDGNSPRYLPDFTIHDADDDLELPQWVEAKPQQFLYDLRDTLGVTRRAGDKFAGVVDVSGVDHDALRSMRIDELWKPKLLAEMTLESVLVVGGVGGTSKLSVEMMPHCIRFRRDHPFVNWVGVQRRIEAEERRQEWERQSEIYRREREERLNNWQAEQQAARQSKLQTVRNVMRYTSVGSPRFASQCCGCSRRTEVGGLYKITQPDGSNIKWMVVCHDCQQAAAA